MALTKEDLQAIVLLLNDGLAPIKKELQAMKSEMVTKEELKKELKNLATKEEMKGLATKEELKGLATKEALKGLATKEALKGLATNEALKGLATKGDLSSLAAKDDLNSLKDDVHFVLEELMKTEVWTERIESKVNNLNDKVDTLLLESDNTALLLKLNNQQTGEIREIKSRVEALEMKLA